MIFENNPSWHEEKSIMLKWWWWRCHFEQLPHPKWNQKFPCRISFSYVMPVNGADIFPKTYQKNLFQLSRNHPTLWPKEAFLPSSSQPTNPQLSPSLFLMFSLVFPKNQKRNRMQACKLFWIAPIKRTGGEMEIEHSFWSPKVEEC